MDAVDDAYEGSSASEDDVDWDEAEETLLQVSDCAVH